MDTEYDETGKPIHYYYRVADPKNPHIFSRVPYEKRSHWLKLWNPTNLPEDVSVYDAFNTLAYCFSYDYQSYHNYAFGRFTGCTKGLDDLKLALRAYGTVAAKETSRGKEKYDKACEELRVSAGETGETNHIFKFRSRPAEFTLLSLYEPDEPTSKN